MNWFTQRLQYSFTKGCNGNNRYFEEESADSKSQVMKFWTKEDLIVFTTSSIFVKYIDVIEIRQYNWKKEIRVSSKF